MPFDNIELAAPKHPCGKEMTALTLCVALHRHDGMDGQRAWMQCQAFLAQAAFDLHPIRFQVLTDIWTAIVRCALPKH